MNVIAAQYPNVFHLLYIWHINKNVLKNCKPAFATEEDWEEFLGAWYRVVYALTRVANRATWTDLVQKYDANFPDEVDYLYIIWFLPWCARFCKYRTDRILHFNTLTTFKVEGGHRVLKAMLQFSLGDLM